MPAPRRQVSRAPAVSDGVSSDRPSRSRALEHYSALRRRPRTHLCRDRIALAITSPYTLNFLMSPLICFVNALSDCAAPGSQSLNNCFGYSLIATGTRPKNFLAASVTPLRDQFSSSVGQAIPSKNATTRRESITTNTASPRNLEQRLTSTLTLYALPSVEGSAPVNDQTTAQQRAKRARPSWGFAPRPRPIIEGL